MGNCINRPTSNTQGYGWVRDTPDFRDNFWDIPESYDKSIDFVDLRKEMGSITNQSVFNCAPVDAVSTLYKYKFSKIAESNISTTFEPSRSFIYYNARQYYNSLVDNGCSIRNTLKSFSKLGACSEHRFELNSRNINQKPTDDCYKNSKRHRVKTYQRLRQDIDCLKAALQNGEPFIFGCSVMSSFDSKEVSTSGIIPLPEDNDKPIAAHAMVAVGYDSNNRLFIVRNSWGESWGDNGYCYIPYDYILNESVCADFWIVHEIEFEILEEKKEIDVFSNLEEISLEDDANPQAEVVPEAEAEATPETTLEIGPEVVAKEDDTTSIKEDTPVAEGDDVSNMTVLTLTTNINE